MLSKKLFTRIRQVILLVFFFASLSGCDFVSNIFKYKDTTREFIENLIKEDYDGCVDLMAMQHQSAKNTNTDELKAGLADFRNIIVNNWGTKLECSFMRAEKTFSTKEEESTPANTTLVFMEIANEEQFGVLQVLFDDHSRKILNIKTLDVREQIPSMFPFWLFGILSAGVLGFNIYVIRKVRRSDLDKKWIMYLAIICLNIPSVTYAAVNGLSFDLLKIQLLFGLSFSYTGYLGSSWTFGIPLGGIYWLWKLRQHELNKLNLYNNPL